MSEVEQDVLDRLCDCPRDVDAVAAMCPVHDYKNFKAAQKVADEACREAYEFREALEKIEAKLDGTLDGISAVESEMGVPPHHETLTECYGIARKALEASDD